MSPQVIIRPSLERGFFNVVLPEGSFSIPDFISVVGCENAECDDYYIDFQKG
jgi:hypothetical protein